MTTVTIDETSRGTTIASEEMLTSITLKSVPTQYGNDYLCLVNQVLGKDQNDNDVVLQENALFNQHIATSHVSVDSNLMSGGRSRFANLVVKDIPPGSSFEIEHEPPPAPPALTSLSPDTAVSGDPDLTLSCIGTGFDADTVIEFGGYDAATTFVSDTEVTTEIRPAMFVASVIPVRVHEGPIYTDPIDFTFTEPVKEE
jgi:hypothetical protein